MGLAHMFKADLPEFIIAAVIMARCGCGPCGTTSLLARTERLHLRLTHDAHSDSADPTDRKLAKGAGSGNGPGG